jgi:Flp pilus assembly protein TadG
MAHELFGARRSKQKKAGQDSDQDAAQDAGQALLETALVFPILLALLIGAAEFARVAYAAIEVANAARAGVQYGAQSGFTAADTTGIATAASKDAANVTGLVTTSSVACICSNGNASTCLNTDCPNSHKEEILTVNTQATMDPLIHVPGLPRTYTLKGRAIQKCVQ